MLNLPRMTCMSFHVGFISNAVAFLHVQNKCNTWKQYFSQCRRRGNNGSIYLKCCMSVKCTVGGLRDDGVVGCKWGEGGTVHLHVRLDLVRSWICQWTNESATAMLTDYYTAMLTRTSMRCFAFVRLSHCAKAERRFAHLPYAALKASLRQATRSNHPGPVTSITSTSWSAAAVAVCCVRWDYTLVFARNPAFISSRAMGMFMDWQIPYPELYCMVVHHWCCTSLIYLFLIIIFLLSLLLFVYSLFWMV